MTDSVRLRGSEGFPAIPALPKSSFCAFAASLDPCTGGKAGMDAESFNRLAGIRRLHLVGVAGSGMCGLAELLLADGFQVTGSDLAEGHGTRHLRSLGSRIYIGHRSDQVGDAQAVVVSSAIPDTNPEVLEARRRGIPVIHRAEVLGELMRPRIGVAVAGTHGKTTTTAMLAEILAYAGLSPTVYVGAGLPGYPSGAIRRSGPYFVAEADESDRSFLLLRPVHAVVTNVDLDHVDRYRSVDEVREAFVDFLGTLPPEGTVTAGVDDPGVAAVLKNVHRRVLTCGLDPEAEYTGRELRPEGTGTVYRLVVPGGEVEVRLRVPGRHNVLNSLAAAAAAHGLGVGLEAIAGALGGFAGAARRLEVKGERNGVLVVDDYAHHPAEVQASLAACRQFGRRIVVVFQPHRYTRTQVFLDDFARVLAGADQVFVMDVYSAGEAPLEGVDVLELVRRAGSVATYAGLPDELVARLGQVLGPGDLLLTMGAGNVWQIGERFLEG